MRRHLDAAERLPHRVLLDEEDAREVDAARKSLLLEELHADVARHEDAAVQTLAARQKERRRAVGKAVLRTVFCGTKLDPLRRLILA